MRYAADIKCRWRGRPAFRRRAWKGIIAMQPRNPAIREGLMFGGGLAVLFIINFFLAYIAGIGLGGLITLVAALAAYLVAGMRAAQTTGRVQSGVIAGLVTGLFSSVVDAVVVMVLTFIFID